MTDGYRELLFGQWMPHILIEEYEAERLPIIDELWDIPSTPALYLEADKMLLTRWQALAASQSGFSSWLPSFYQMNNSSFEPFHPICRFYRSVLWCESRMIMQVLHQWQEQMELTILKYELVSLQNQLIDYLLECKKRISGSISNPDKIIATLFRYLNSLVKDSILILLVEINERFGHLLEERELGVDEIFVRYLETQVPSRKGWFSTVDRMKWYLKGIQEDSEAGKNITELLTQLKKEQSQQDPLNQDRLLDSRHILENAWFCWKIFSEQKGSETLLYISEPEKQKDLLLKWKQTLLGHSKPDEKSEKEHREIYNTILSCLTEILYTLETEREPFSEAAEMTLLIKDLFSEEATHTGTSQIPGKNFPPNTEGHWLLDQYIPLYQVQEKLSVTPRTMRTYISDYNLEVIEITAKSKWVHAEDFEMFMEQFKKKSTHRRN